MLVDFQGRAYRLAPVSEAGGGGAPVQGGSPCVRACHALSAGTPLHAIPLLYVNGKM